MIFTIRRLLSLPRIIKQTIMIVFDILALELSIILSYSLRQASFFIPSGEIEKLVYLAPLLAVPIFYFFGLYKSVVRFMGIKAFSMIFYAISLYMITWSMIGFFINVDVPRSVLIYHDNGTIYKVSEYFSGFFVLCIINWMVCLLLIGSSRIITRQIFWGIKKGFFDLADDRKNVIIYGAGVAGIQLANALYFSKELKPVSFIDDNNALISKEIMNLKIYSFSKISYLIKKLDVKEILVAIPSINKKQKSLMIDKLKQHPIKFSFLPGIRQIEKGIVKVEDLKSIKIEDVLGRDQIPPKKNLLKKNIEKKNILVTGAGGSIGSELCKQILKLSPKIIVLFEQNEFALYEVEKKLNLLIKDKGTKIFPILGNVCNKEKVYEILGLHNITSVFHAAAYKHVPLVEANIFEAFQNNIIGTLNCAEAANEMNIDNFVLISTDKAVRPTNFMGATKRFSEMIIQSLSENSNTKFSAVRFGNVLGSSGSVIPLFENQIMQGGPITVTDENVIRYFMTVEEASQLVIQASSITKGNIFVLDMGEPIKIVDLAKKMIELSGLTWSINKNKSADIDIIYTGLRPGEKLFEELSIDKKINETEHSKIISIEEDFISFNRLKEAINSFRKYSSLSDNERTIKLISKIVVDYKPDQRTIQNNLKAQ